MPSKLGGARGESENKGEERRGQAIDPIYKFLAPSLFDLFALEDVFDFLLAGLERTRKTFGWGGLFSAAMAGSTLGAVAFRLTDWRGCEYREGEGRLSSPESMAH
jgi:hypothetical protein